MENASKALMMAAGVLIGIMILSLAVYLFANFGSASAEAHRQNEENQLAQFNAQFTTYQYRTDVTIHDVITVANLARSNNQTYYLDDSVGQTESNYYIVVNATTTTGIKNNLQNPSLYDTNDLNTIIEEDINNMKDVQDQLDPSIIYKELYTYICTVEINPNTERVSTVTFKINK